jgi:ABC-type phosphate/phosphonate transport system substrate-binding protein
MRAAAEGHTAVVLALIDGGADVNVVNNVSMYQFNT